jgi:hypothetical protein
MLAVLVLANIEVAPGIHNLRPTNIGFYGSSTRRTAGIHPPV